MVWDRGEYQAALAADHGTLKRKMGLALVFGAPDEIETADQINDSRRECPADLQCEPATRPESVADLAQRQFNHPQCPTIEKNGAGIPTDRSEVTAHPASVRTARAAVHRSLVTNGRSGSML